MNRQGAKDQILHLLSITCALMQGWKSVEHPGWVKVDHPKDYWLPVKQHGKDVVHFDK